MAERVHAPQAIPKYAATGAGNYAGSPLAGYLAHVPSAL